MESATLQSGEAVHILWQVNVQASGGFVIELSNPHGVAKAPCAPMVLDSQGAVRVKIVLQVGAGMATDWSNGQVVAAGPLGKGDALTVTVAPGNATYVEFAPSRAVVAAADSTAKPLVTSSGPIQCNPKAVPPEQCPFGDLCPQCGQPVCSCPGPPPPPPGPPPSPPPPGPPATPQERQCAGNFTGSLDNKSEPVCL